MSKEPQQGISAIRRRLSVGWPPFADRLEEVLRALDEDQYLVITVKRTNRFVQFAGQGAHGMRAETTSNHFLDPSERLDGSQIEALRASGWQSQTGSPEEAIPEKDPDGSPNFFVDFAAPVSFDRVAELAVRMLAEILRVPHPGFLEYDAFDDDGNAVVLPALRLKHAAPLPLDTDRSALPQRLVATIRQAMDIDDLEFDDDGDIGVRFGSVAVFVRLVGNPPCVRIHSGLLQDVEETPELLSSLNDLNFEVKHLRLLIKDRVVYAVADAPAEPFIAEHVASAFLYFCHISDGIDSLLQTEFGGKTAFAELAPNSLKH